MIGLVAPVGADLDEFQAALEVVLREFDYTWSAVRVSELAVAMTQTAADRKDRSRSVTPEFRRLNRLMNLGNAARAWGNGDALALAAAAAINAKRTGTNGTPGPLKRHAHVIRSLKHPGEVLALRRIYGPGFFLVGVIASSEERREFLRKRKGCTETEVTQLFERDEREDNDLGQRTRDTFHLADAFVPFNDRRALKRFVDLIFGAPYETPTRDEYAMHLAFSAALRSADLSRQVGAVIVSKAGDLVAVGTNDVPRAGGGLFWPGPGDRRDWSLGLDTNETERQKIVDEILTILGPKGTRIASWKKEAWNRLRSAGALVMDITEYGRAAHAEMEALLSCARSGIRTQGTTLYSTTFPCHNCAKHILAAGVARVVYVEPYPKSRAADLYPESIALQSRTSEGDARVPFCPFEGIGPRRFFDLFSIGMSTGYPVKRKEAGKTRAWHPRKAELRVPLLPNSYIGREAAAAAKLMEMRSDRVKR